MNPQQIKTVKIAQKFVNMGEEQYRLMLANVAGVETCKDLDQRGFEDVMAVLEDMGFEAQSGTHWRDTVRNRGSFASKRMVWKIRELHEEYEKVRGDRGAHYELGGLVNRFSNNRTYDVTRLMPREAWTLIEALKAMVERVAPAIPLLTVPQDDIPF